MSKLGVQVSLVEPGNYDSQIARNAEKRGVVSQYAADRSNYKEPDDVADAVEKTLFEPNPKRRYMVAPTQDEAEVTIRKQIEQLVQQNERQAYTFDRDSLIKMLDEALAGSRPRKNQR